MLDDCDESMLDTINVLDDARAVDGALPVVAPALVQCVPGLRGCAKVEFEPDGAVHLAVRGGRHSAVHRLNQVVESST